ncbi:bacillithiol biosynthesis cysteine-adding enzyme BshC [Marininema mesophilum]|uniref:Putative cysteine ligase BshC n=1 Tax=Marininema mesophilum TaxID=1048340 RepID=A0A1H2QFE3_9BACL|nr:bacillithiol biosynthesis cysteine-adding enzyme BshC [Marininema mesophilum]SDW05931.1 bacillithiol biosynthesis cysteine-adding enzyme BshC [Marininema mesophilum]
MRIEDIYLESSNPLFRDYLQTFQKTIDFYTYDPGDDTAFSVRAHRLSERVQSAPRHELVKVLRQYHGEELTSSEVEANLKRLEDPRSLSVVGGQQAGLFMGPLYTLYKAITLIQLASREEQRLGRPVIPVFWIAGEDHDIEEVDHIHLSLRKELVKLQIDLGIETKKRISISEIELDDQLDKMLEQLANLLPDTPHKQGLLEEMRQLAYQPSSISRHFARMMHRLFSPFGLIFIDSAYPPLRQLEVPFFEWLILEAKPISDRVLATAGRLQEKGYPLQVEPEEGRVHLFLREDGERTALYLDGEGFRNREGDQRWSRQEILRRLYDRPEDFSNNVVTRPLMQEFLFPTLATVLGTGEITYWALLKSAFEHAGMEMPILYPRVGVTLIGPREEKWLRRYQLTPYAAIHHLKEREQEWLATQYQVDAEQTFARIRQRVEEIYQPLLGDLRGLRSDLVNKGEMNRERVLREFGWLENEVRKALAERSATDGNRFNELALYLCPNGMLQERVHNVLPYWNQYGENWIRRLGEIPLLSKESHRVVYL